MIRFLFRCLSLLLLAGAVTLAVLDATRGIAAGAWNAAPLGRLWAEKSPESFEKLQGWTAANIGAEAWPRLARPVLDCPAFAVLAALALLAGMAGYRPERREKAQAAAGRDAAGTPSKGR